MPTTPLPQDPDLGQLRKRARELQRAIRAGDPVASALVAEFQPDSSPGATYTLSAAQLVLARSHGFASWPRLRRHIETVTARTWTPGTEPPPNEPLADQFLRLACLSYRDDRQADRVAATQLLSSHPELAQANLAVAAACADVEQVTRLLAEDRTRSTHTAGPYGWSPLLYQAYARHDPDIGLDATLQTARLLLAAGADPNDGRFWHGLPTPFTVLTGVLGSGEQDQPRHPHANAFARLLLVAGADPNDGQALYNRMFGRDDDHLVLLFEFGLGRRRAGRAAGPWHRLLGEALESPPVMLRNLLWWAITHDQRERVALLADNGVDVTSPFNELRMPGANGRTPVEVAVINGNLDVAADLMALGARPPQLRPQEAFVAAVLAGDAHAVHSTDPATVDAVRRRWPGLVVWAASRSGSESVELLVAAGFDINAYGRSDAPVRQAWHTSLHAAVEIGDRELARRLLTLGADPQLRDARFDGTPLDWARHLDQPVLVQLLAPITAEQPGP